MYFVRPYLIRYADTVSKDLLIVMRCYFEKPRTTVGWKGLINDPDLDGTFKINKGLRIGRELMLKINQMGERRNSKDRQVLHCSLFYVFMAAWLAGWLAGWPLPRRRRRRRHRPCMPPSISP